MTPPPTPEDPDAAPLDADELAVHAVLDDEATPDERRRVARDPRLRARLEEVRAAAAAVAAPPPAAEADLARIRATAVAALGTDPAAGDDEPGTGDEGAGTGDGGGGPDQTAGDPTVVPLTARRPRRLPPLPAVAAVVLVLLVVGVGLIATGRGGDGDASADGGQTAAESQAGGADEESADDAAGSGAASPEAGTAPDTPLPEGTRTFASDEDLRVVLQDVDPTSLDALAPPPAGDSGEAGAGDAAASAAETEDGARCGKVLRASDSAIGPVQAAALVEVDGTPLLVLSTPVAATAEAPASTRLTVLEAASCVPRFAVQRDP